LNAGGYGFYRVAYDAKTLANDTSAFASFPDPDKIALLDNQWSLARAGKSDLGSYFHMAAKMGSDYDARAWEQIVDAFTTLEKDERGKPQHAALVTQARALVAPVVSALGWSPKSGEAPPVRVLRNQAILALGLWGDPAVIGESRRRFAKFEHNRSSLTPDQQETVLKVVAAYADAATFQRLHELALSARVVPEVERYYGALVSVRDPKLAALAMHAVLTDPILPQAQMQKGRLIFDAADINPRASWSAFKTYEPSLSRYAPPAMLAVYMSGSIMKSYGGSIPSAEIMAWMHAHFPPQAAPYINKALAQANVVAAERARLAAEVDTELSKARN
jgi:aminopeptidase N